MGKMGEAGCFVSSRSQTFSQQDRLFGNVGAIDVGHLPKLFYRVSLYFAISRIRNPTSAIILLFGNQLFNFLNDFVICRNLFRRISGNNTAIAVNQKFCKVPTDIPLEISFRR